MFALNISCKQSELAFLKTLAVNYNPDCDIRFMKSLSLTEDECNLLKNAIEIDKKKALQYTSLILLKEYRCHLLCCNQSFELRQSSSAKDCISYNYLIQINLINPSFNLMEPPRPVWSSKPLIWLEENPEYLTGFKELRILFDDIQKLEKTRE